jgi:hypothetical protein
MVFYVASFKQLPPYNMSKYNNWGFHLRLNHIWEIPLYFLQHHACVNTHTYFSNNLLPKRQIENTPISIPLLWKCLQKKKRGSKKNSLRLEGHEKISICSATLTCWIPTSLIVSINIGFISHHPTFQLQKTQTNNFLNILNLR